MTDFHASTEWIGGLRDGGGQVTTESGAVTEHPFCFSTRFGDEPGTNPEELIAAGIASCFSMTLAMALEACDAPPERIDTRVTITSSRRDGGMAITLIALEVKCCVSGVSDEFFQKIVSDAERRTPVACAISVPMKISANRVP